MPAELLNTSPCGTSCFGIDQATPLGRYVLQEDIPPHGISPPWGSKTNKSSCPLVFWETWLMILSVAFMGWIIRRKKKMYGPGAARNRALPEAVQFHSLYRCHLIDQHGLSAHPMTGLEKGATEPVKIYITHACNQQGTQADRCQISQAMRNWSIQESDKLSKGSVVQESLGKRWNPPSALQDGLEVWGREEPKAECYRVCTHVTWECSVTFPSSQSK